MVSDVYNEDCMTGMSRYPDKFFELAIVDPPYGINDKISIGGKESTKSTVSFHNKYNEKKWDILPIHINYFDELFRVSENQIICGGNYFKLPPTRGIICWDKMKQVPNFSQWEMIWTSFDKLAMIFKYMWHGNYHGYDGKITLKSTSIEIIHPTQKPIALYKWLLSNYANLGDKILDTHLGSGSSRIAAYDMGFDFTGFEIDADYFAAQEKRFELFKSQLTIPFQTSA